MIIFCSTNRIRIIYNDHVATNDLLFSSFFFQLEKYAIFKYIEIFAFSFSTLEFTSTIW